MSLGGSENVFISWSKERSRHVAEALAEWIPNVIQTAVPYFSPESLSKGSIWTADLMKALQQFSVGVFCLTPENVGEPWINFEAGALAKVVSSEQYVCTYLLGELRVTDIEGPLKMFNHTKADDADTLKLLSSVNAAMKQPLSQDQLKKSHEKWWPDLEKKLSAIPPPPATAVQHRSAEDMIPEILETVRSISKRLPVRRRIPPSTSSQMLAEAFKQQGPAFDALREAAQKMVSQPGYAGRAGLPSPYFDQWLSGRLPWGTTDPNVKPKPPGSTEPSSE